MLTFLRLQTCVLIALLGSSPSFAADTAPPLVPVKPAGFKQRDPAATREFTARLDALEHVAPYRQWRFVRKISLSHPLGHVLHTAHPQGLNIAESTLALSTQRRPYGAVLFYHFVRDAFAIRAVEYQSTVEFTEYPGQNHAGGLGRDELTNRIFVPVAAAMFGNSNVVSLPADGNLQGGHPAEIARFPFHVGTVFFEPEREALYAIGRDPGFHFEFYGNTLYTIDFKNLGSVSPRGYYNFSTPFVSFASTAYQDCKPVGGEGYFLCSNKEGSSFLNIHGSLDLIQVKADGSYSLKDIVRIPVPRVKPDGTLLEGSGPYLPERLGDPPLSYNGFDFELSPAGDSVIFYFAPHNEPETNLYIYEAPILR